MLTLIIYKNELPPAINTLLEPIICTDDTRVITFSKMFDDLCTILITDLSHVGIWFASKKLTLNKI